VVRHRALRVQLAVALAISLCVSVDRGDAQVLSRRSGAVDAAVVARTASGIAAAAVWVERSGRGSSLRVAPVSSTEGRFARPRTLVTTKERMHDLVAGADSDGRVTIGWIAGTGRRAAIYVLEGGTARRPKILSRRGARPRTLGLAVGGTGDMIAAWDQAGGQAIAERHQGSWTTTLHSVHRQDSRTLAAAADGGMAMVYTVISSDAAVAVHLAVAAPGARLGPVAQVRPPAFGWTGCCALTLDGGGAATLAWYETTPESVSRVLLAGIGGGLPPSILLDAPGADTPSRHPEVSRGPGEASAWAWSDPDKPPIVVTRASSPAEVVMTRLPASASGLPVTEVAAGPDQAIAVALFELALPENRIVVFKRTSPTTSFARSKTIAGSFKVVELAWLGQRSVALVVERTPRGGTLRVVAV
jgi:hypothetical protein